MFTIKFNTDGAAFSEAPEYEIARILRKISDSVQKPPADGKIHDTNGNKIGEWKWSKR